MNTETATPEEEILEPDSQEPVDEPAEDEGQPDEAVAAEPEPDAPAEAESAEQPEEEAEAADEAPPAEEEPALPDAETPETEPEAFSFRVDGTSVDVDGATVEEDTITIPKDSWDRVVQKHLADRSQIQAREQAYQRRLQQAEQGRSDKEQRAEILLKKVDELLGDPNALASFYEDYERNAKQLRLEVENELLKAQHGQASERVQQFDRQQQATEFEQIAKPGLSRGIEHVLSEDEFNGLDLDMQTLHEDLWGLYEQGTPVFFQAAEGDGSGLQPGEMGVNLNVIRQTLRPAAKVYQKTAAQQKAEQVKAKNKKAVAKSKKAPPTASAKGSPAPSTTPKPPQTLEEYQEWKERRSKELNIPLS